MPNETKNGELSAGTFWILGEGVLTKCQACHIRPVVTLACLSLARGEYRLMAQCPTCGNATAAGGDVELMVKWNRLNAPLVVPPAIPPATPLAPSSDPETAGFQRAKTIREML